MAAGRDLFGDVSTADTGTRDAFDFYETPAWMTRTLLHWMPEIAGTRVLECCAGRGAISRVLADAGCTVSNCDIDPRHNALYCIRDMRLATSWSDLIFGFDDEFDWIITNPPFTAAHQILEHAVQHARVGVAFLLRKTFTEPTRDYKRNGLVIPARGPWLAANPPRRIIGLPRISFRGDGGTDAVSTDWHIWLRNPSTALVPPFIIDPEAESR